KLYQLLHTFPSFLKSFFVPYSHCSVRYRLTRLGPYLGHTSDYSHAYTLVQSRPTSAPLPFRPRLHDLVSYILVSLLVSSLLLLPCPTLPLLIRYLTPTHSFNRSRLMSWRPRILSLLQKLTKPGLSIGTITQRSHLLLVIE
ncbi:hypothetical protein BDP27DRAFT_1526535, partial [Rhodocollybia butyracea]